MHGTGAPRGFTPFILFVPSRKSKSGRVFSGRRARARALLEIQSCIRCPLCRIYSAHLRYDRRAVTRDIVALPSSTNAPRPVTNRGVNPEMNTLRSLS